MNTRAVAYALTAALCLTGCPDRRHTRPDPPLTSAGPALSALAARNAAINTLSGLLALEIWRNGDRVRLRQLVIVQRPDRIRLDTLSPFDQPLQMMASDGETLAVYSLEEKRFFRGPATPRNLARLLPIELEGPELIAFFQGRTPLIVHTESSIAWDDDRGAWQVDLTGAGRRQQLHFEPAHLRVTESQVWRTGALEYKARFCDYSGHDDTAVPRRIRIEVPSKDLSIDIEVREFTVGEPVDPEAFGIDPPRGIRVEPFN